MSHFNRLEPYRFIFPLDTSVDEATETAVLLELGLDNAEREGASQVRPVCYGLVLTTLN